MNPRPGAMALTVVYATLVGVLAVWLQAKYGRRGLWICVTAGIALGAMVQHYALP